MAGEERGDVMDREGGPSGPSAHHLGSTEVHGNAVRGQPSADVSPRVVLGVLWLSHFLLWTFGDMFALLQGITEAVTEPVFLIVAPTTAIVQASMAALSLVGAIRIVRRANLVVAPLFALLNVGFLVEASHAWEYYLGAFYLAFSLLILGYAAKRLVP